MRKKLKEKRTTGIEDTSDPFRPSVMADIYKKVSFVESGELKHKLKKHRPAGLPEDKWNRSIEKLICSLFTVSVSIIYGDGYDFRSHVIFIF